MSQAVTTHCTGFDWIDILNPEPAEMDDLTRQFQLDPNIGRDVLQAGHLPKMEDYANGQFMILRAYTAEENQTITNIHHLSDKVAFFVNDQQLLTFHKYPFDFMEEIQSHADTARFTSPFSLMLDMIGKILKTYTEPANWHTQEIDKIERNLFLSGTQSVSMEDLYYQKLEVRLTKKVLMLNHSALMLLKVDAKSRSHLQDIKDQLQHLILEYEEAFEDANTLTNTYLSINSKKNNEVMRLLTIFSAFFLPMTFIAGVYGMNFKNMPELNSPNGFYEVVLAMLLVSILIYLWFRKKKIL